MKYTNIPAAHTVISYCKAYGISNIIISPGSRNAPLTLGFTEDPYFNCFSIVDERCAAFFALGIAQEQREPTAVVCTSGSALLNYYPAIAEAFYSTIPLVVISADRPLYKVDIGDGQTIRQENIFQNHIGFSGNLKQDMVHATEVYSKYAKNDLLDQGAIQEYNENIVKQALNIALHQKLPIHINIPFEEPLYGVVASPVVEPDIIPLVEPILNTIQVSDFTATWQKATRKMILIGVNYEHSLNAEVIASLANDPSVLVFTETTSNVHHPNFFPSIDSILAPIEKSAEKNTLFAQLKPEVLVTFGGLIVSKKIKAFLRTHQPLEHWHIDPLKANDTFFCLTHHIKANPSSFLASIQNEAGAHKASEYFAFWNELKTNFEVKRAAYLSQIPFSDMKAFECITAAIPENYQVQVANSSSIRYMQLFPSKPTLKVHCNRGTSGIDGSTATAVGAAVYHKEPTVLITGDLSFLYDSNGLWNAAIRKDFRIIVVNNSGGGIFRILPGKEDSPNFNAFFETQHQLDASHLSKMFGFEYENASSTEEVEDAFQRFFIRSNSPKLLEITTPSAINDKILLGYFDFLY